MFFLELKVRLYYRVDLSVIYEKDLIIFFLLRLLITHAYPGNPIYELKHQQESTRDSPEWTIQWADQVQFTCEGMYGTDGLECDPSTSYQVNQDQNDFSDIYYCVVDDAYDGPVDSLAEELGQCYEFVDLNWLTQGDKSRIWYSFIFEYAEYPESIAPVETLPAYISGQDKDVYISEGADGIVLAQYEANRIGK